MSIRRVLQAQNASIENLVATFEEEVRRAIAVAQAVTMGEVQKKLAMDGGIIRNTAANRRVLRSLDSIFEDALDRSGLPMIIREFVASWDGQFVFFDQILDEISRNLKRPLIVTFSGTDAASFAAQKAATTDALSSVLESIGNAVRTRAMFSVGGLPYSTLVDWISRTYSRSLSEAATLADTGTAMFARTITERGFRKIEEQHKPGALRYRYEGPDDALTRPVCHKWLRQTRERGFTREKIERLDNGQLPNAFVSGGGYRCRHQWVISEIKE